MAKIIEGQTIASTHTDSHGERLSRDELFGLFNGRPPSRSMGDNHDLSKLPICRAFNDRLEELPDGELSWKVDIEVFDEEAFSRFGGFSIGFTRRHVRLGRGDVEAKLTVNTRQFDFETVVQEVSRAVRPRHVVEVVERVEKADVIVAAVVGISAFVATGIAAGFFSSIGESLFEAAKKLRRKDAPSAPTNIHFHLHLHPERKLPMVLLAIHPDCTATDVRNVSERMIHTAIERHLPLNQLERAVLKLLPGGALELEFVTNERGEVVYRKNRDA